MKKQSVGAYNSHVNISKTEQVLIQLLLLEYIDHAQYAWMTCQVKK